MLEQKSVPDIPQEMREVSVGSFPLSPGTFTGHQNVSELYWHYRKDLLEGKSIEDIFGTDTPKEPEAPVIPGGHRFIRNANGVNQTVWNHFLNTSFNLRPDVDSFATVNSLISVNAGADNAYFDERLISGKRSKIALGSLAPSLLRAFVFEDRFPTRGNIFYLWLMSEVATQILDVQQTNTELRKLISKWNTTFPDIPFIPEK